MVLKMEGNRTGVVKVHCKSPGKSCSGKTNIRTIFFGNKISQETFKQIYVIGSIEKSKKNKHTLHKQATSDDGI